MKSPKPLFLSPTVELLLLSCVALVILIIIGIGISQRLLLRVGLRNMLRRRAQALLLIGGLTLSTAFITASFVLNDSIQQASNAQLLGDIGNIDVTVTGAFSQEQATSYMAAIRQQERIQAVTSLLTSYQAASVLAPQTGMSRDRLNVVAVPPDFNQVFGPARDIHGQPVRFSDLHDGEVYLSSSLAQNFPIQPGDRIDLNLSGHHVTVTVRALLGTNIATNGSDIIFANAEQVILPLSYYQRIAQPHDPVNTIALSNVHHTDDSAEVASFLGQLFHISSGNTKTTFSYSNAPVFTSPEINVIQPDLIYYLGTQSFTNGLGNQGAAQFTQLAPAISMLLVGTGMFLLTLLLVLLATERRVEMGISRALGFTRRHVVGALLIEGGGYGMMAIIPGILAGVGLVALELYILSFIPLQVGGKSTATIHLTLSLVIDWHSLLAAL
ncbi:MAG: ABC transporter permease, partial [Ktedonobacteraceae bacterium]|nr:ABC transporter permease [Ktedonobacteraceae bacterium]